MCGMNLKCLKDDCDCELDTLAKLVDYTSAAREIEKMVIKLDSSYPVQFKLRAAQDTTNPQTGVFHSILEKVRASHLVQSDGDHIQT